MEVLFFLIPLSFLMAFGALGAFIWAVKNDQFDDLCKPAERIITDEWEEMN